MKIKLLFVALLAGAGAYGAQAGAADSSSTVAYTLQFQGPTALVNVHPNAKHGVLAHPLPGDGLYARSRVVDAGGQLVGRTSEACTMTVRRPATYDCSLALLFKDGSELLVHGALNPMRTPWTAPVVGGTGRFSGMRGTVDVTDAPRGERWTFSFA